MGFRTRPPAVVDGPIGAGTLDLPQACARAQATGLAAVQVHADRPAHAGQDAARQALQERARPRHGDRRRARRAGRGISTPTSCRSTRRTCPGSPGRMGVGRGGDQPRARCGQDDARRAPLLRQLRRPVDPEGHLGEADRVSQRAARRPYRDGDRAPSAGGTCGVPRPEAGDRLRPWRHRHQGDRDRDGRHDRARDRARGDRRSAPAASSTSIRTAASGCSSAASPTARFRALVAGRDLFEGRGSARTA